MKAQAALLAIALTTACSPTSQNITRAIAFQECMDKSLDDFDSVSIDVVSELFDAPIVAMDETGAVTEITIEREDFCRLLANSLVKHVAI